MPRDQGHLREGAPYSTSKTAKDKSNSSALQASQGGRQPALLRDRDRDSEKDSGYSEASSDDQRSSRSRPVRENGKNLNGRSANAGRSPYGDPPPVYVLKNLVVKPSAPELLHGSLAWTGGWHKPQTQLLLIQQPAASAPQSSAPTPPPGQPSPQNPPKKGGGCSRQGHGSRSSYLPILNSYPRIAPHPRKDSHETKGPTWAKGAKESGGEGQSQSKRVCTEEEKWDLVSTTSDLQSRSQDPVQSSGVRFSSAARPQSSGRDCVGSPSISSSQTPSPPSLSDSPSSSSPPSSSLPSSTATSPRHPAGGGSSARHSATAGSSARQRRFLNTAEILQQSGLLAITLRTKELLKQNAATDRELAQLRQHTQLLCQAAWGGQGGQVGPGGQRWSSKTSDSLNKLLQTMSESGSYPGLDVEGLKVLGRTRNQGDQGDQEDQGDQRRRHGRTSTVHSSCPSVVTLHYVDDGTSPPSPLFAPSPDATERPLDPLDPPSLCASLQRPPSKQDGPPLLPESLAKQ
ncbi:CLOCK-interacting pacemaker-like isoform X2 [Salarias fasciatus]|uniref:CLOCK-interacting pacemaker-like n=2 Tax=Salarias fasciatus TaxID=181472 RepID=A0A672FZG7_SALFA|nr:CLOCK-interacting pacemaker-like isoform X2 [Salarias fasciatus]